jgi:hypothetical protein
MLGDVSDPLRVLRAFVVNLFGWSGVGAPCPFVVSVAPW